MPPEPSRLPKLPANPYVIVGVSVAVGLSAGLAVSAWLDSRKPPCPCTEVKLPQAAQGSAAPVPPVFAPSTGVPVPTETVFDQKTATVVERPIPVDGTGPDPVP